MDVLEFFSFSDANVRFVSIGAMLITASSAIVGTFTFLDKRSLIGDTIAHSVLPGICLSFLLVGRKDPVALVAGAFVTGWISVYLVELITRKSRIKEDTAIGLILSVFFGLGILLLTVIQKTGDAAQSGLDSYIFGSAASLVGEDLVVFGIVAALVLLLTAVHFKGLTLLAFDRPFAEAIGFPVKRLRFILTVLVVLAVVIGIQTVGVVLMAAMLITPAAAARFWTDRLIRMVFLAAVFGAISGLSGAYLSWLVPSSPTGPWIVLVISALALLSFFLSPRRGILARWIRQRRHRRTIQEENLLKALYQLSEVDESFSTPRSEAELESRRHMESAVRRQALNRLTRDGYLIRSAGSWALTAEGKHRGKRIVRIHRLWELYLTTKMNIAPDHVHDDAETMEHLITPELEAELERQLDYPKQDPHESKIPGA